MKLAKFADYQSYVNAQSRVTRKKALNMGGHGTGCDPAVVHMVSKNFRRLNGEDFAPKGICHGVRFGDELDMFEAALGGEWVGTEICEDLCDGKRIINIDFDAQPDEWANHFDLIYSNSLDHSRQPLATARAWVNCLGDRGRLYVEWTKWSNRSTCVADCFCGSLDEYIDLFSRVGKVADVLVYEIGKKVKKTWRVLVVTKQ